MVDDPYQFGQIAVANAVSDLYAMGATPLTGLNIVGFPIGKVSNDVLSAILLGGADKAAEARLTVVGGHTVDDAEPKFGMAVTGLVAPSRVVTNAGGKAGDRLVLTKPLGVGILSTAIKQGLASPELVARAVESMAALNRAASEVMVRVGVHAATDVTGFGLLGHLAEMANGAGLGAQIHFSAVPVFPEAWEFAKQDVVPGGTEQNLEFLRPQLRVAPGLGLPEQLLLADAQTSGGLLIAVAPERLSELVMGLEDAGVLAAEIGELVPGRGIAISP
jgi:selenide,water dikinase